MSQVQNKKVLITGGGSGIGRGVVERFIDEGANVGVMDISEQRVAELNDEFGDDVVAVQGDVTLIADNERAVETTVDQFGGLDVLIGNAGIFDHMTGLDGYSSEELADSFDELFGVNVKGYLLTAKAAIPELKQTNGCIVFTASYASANATGGGILYTASKHAVAGIIRRLGNELAPDIRVNGVAPGYVPTNLEGISRLDQGTLPVEPDDVENPLQTIPDPDEYAGYYTFLASEDATPSTGTIIQADCGSTIRC